MPWFGRVGGGTLISPPSVSIKDFLGMPAENWNRKTWAFAGPVMLSNISVPLLGAVDTAVVGHLPGPYFLGAVAVGALIFNVVYHGCNFLRMGTTGLTAQSLGARDADDQTNQ